MKTLLLSSALFLAGAAPLYGQLAWYNVGAIVPDGDAAGVAKVQTVSTPVTAIANLSVMLEFTGVGAGGYNGDLYVTLEHDGAFSVLLNRVGRRVGGQFGYADNGLSVTLDDAAPQGDIHTYRLNLSGSHTVPLGGPLTGLWAPDARYMDPDEVLDTSPRIAGLQDFVGLNPNGQWTLFVADVQSGGQMELVGWGLDITAVPEPATLATAVAVGLLGLCVYRRRQQTGPPG